MDVSLKGGRFVNVGRTYSFGLSLNDLESINSITKISLQIGKNIWDWDVDSSTIPTTINLSARMPDIVGAWKPKFIVEGYDQSRYEDRREVEFSMPIVSTNYSPIFDTRLGCSISPYDQSKIDPIRNLLSVWDFDYYTLGLEIEPISPSGSGLLQSEKDWAQGGDCFIAVLTQRDLSAVSGRGKPSAWLHTELGLSYKPDKPILAFIEQGVEAEALYRQLDSDHIIEFDPSNINNLLSETSEQLSRLGENVQTITVESHVVH